MNGWLDAIRDLLDRGEPGVLVTVIGVRGSAPREVGARMLVSGSATIGTIGGGQLEYQCTRSAVERMKRNDLSDLSRRRFPLGADCGQCCGGVVDILFEDVQASAARFDELIQLCEEGRPAVLVTRIEADGALQRSVSTAERDLDRVGDGRARRFDDAGATVVLEPVTDSRFDVAVFGAGHVGSATVALLATLDASIRWIDQRANLFPERLPHGAQSLVSSDPAREVAALPAGSHVLVMTHSHPLDYAICVAALERNDLAWIGLIGSRAKRRRFEKRFQAEGITGYERIVCPIGIEGIRGKRPAEIALAVSAQIARHRDGTIAPTRSFELIEGEAR